MILRELLLSSHPWLKIPRIVKRVLIVGETNKSFKNSKINHPMMIGRRVSLNMSTTTKMKMTLRRMKKLSRI
jgi:hypothetical protein